MAPKPSDYWYYLHDAQKTLRPSRNAEEHEALRESVHNFVVKELAPHAEEWEETTFPSSVFPRMGELGFLGLSMPEQYGGQGGDYFYNLVLAEELSHSNSGGLAMGVAVHTGEWGVADELRLAPGVLAVAAVKATNVVVELPSPAP